MLLTLPRWIAHRGGGALAPENTLAGIRLAARMGYRAVEFDVMLSGDGTPVLIHDETLERTTNGQGRVAETADAELFRLDAGQGEPIPRLDEALALCRTLGLLANIEIKPSTGQDIDTADAVIAHCRDWPGSGLISSFSLPALAQCRAQLPQLPRGVLFERLPSDWAQWVRELGATTLHCAATEAAGPHLPEIIAAGVPVVCYTVNAPETAKMLFGMGVTACFTDALDTFVAETTAYKPLQLMG